MLFRRIIDRDYAELLRLQESNLLENLSAGQQEDGFLSARFSAGQFAQMNRDAAVLAAAFISKTNSRSLAAHVDGLGMTVLGDYAFGAGRYWIAAFGIPPTDLVCGVGPRQR